MSVGGNPKRCPKPCPSVSFKDKPSVHLYSETDEIIACKEKIQLIKSKENTKVESKDLIESDIDLVEIKLKLCMKKRMKIVLNKI